MFLTAFDKKSTMLHQPWKTRDSSSLGIIDSCQQRSIQTLTQQSISLQWTFLQKIITNTCSKHWLCLLHDLSKISPMVQMHNYQRGKEILINVGKQVMLSSNLWVQSRPFNGALGLIMPIVYTHGSSTHKFPTYVIVASD